MNYESVVWIVLLFLVASTFSLTNLILQQRFHLRSLNIKVDALLKAQGITWPSLSPEVQSLALDPARKIAAIKLHREENPHLGLAEAKSEIEAFAAKKR